MTLQSMLGLKLLQVYMLGVSSNIDAKINHEYKNISTSGDNNDSALAQVMFTNKGKANWKKKPT